VVPSRARAERRVSGPAAARARKIGLRTVTGSCRATTSTRSISRPSRVGHPPTDPLAARGGRTAIGTYGLSLGGYTTTLLASLEPELACVIAGIPAPTTSGSPLGPAWVAAPPGRVRRPLARPRRADHGRHLAARVRAEGPWDRRFLYAATADRLVPPATIVALWDHWERPRSTGTKAATCRSDGKRP
jgi:hypothetical protein